MKIQTLANKYRPKEFSDVVGQDVTVKILENQIINKDFKNALLFTGPAGVGKTTLATILASKINGTITMIDAATNNGVSDIKEIINSSKTSPLIGEYKVIVFDEAHCITPAAWSSFLITLEDPPAKTIFIFCTTDPQKIPNTILSRIQRFNLSRIPLNTIKERLINILNIEKNNNPNITYTEEAIDYICKLCNGGLRDALTYVDKCLLYSDNIDLDNVQNSLDLVSFEIMFNLIDSIIDKNIKVIYDIVDVIYTKGYNFSLFTKQLTELILDCILYITIQDSDDIFIPEQYISKIKGTKEQYLHILDRLVILQEELKQNYNPKATFLSSLLLMI